MTGVSAPRRSEVSSCPLPKPWLFCPRYQVSCRDCLPICYSNNFAKWTEASRGQTPSPHFLSDDGHTWTGLGNPSQQSLGSITGERVKSQFRLGNRKSAPCPVCRQQAQPQVTVELAGSNLSPGHCGSEGSSSCLSRLWPSFQ